MINWILGALIVGLTVYIVGRRISRMKKGGTSCGCGGCDGCGQKSDCGEAESRKK